MGLKMLIGQKIFLMCIKNRRNGKGGGGTPKSSDQGNDCSIINGCGYFG